MSYAQEDAIIELRWKGCRHDLDVMRIDLYRDASPEPHVTAKVLCNECKLSATSRPWKWKA